MEEYYQVWKQSQNINIHVGTIVVEIFPKFPLIDFSPIEFLSINIFSFFDRF